MLITVTNETDDTLEVGFPIARTLAANGEPGDSVTLGVNLRDMLFDELRGDTAWRRLNTLRKEGTATILLAEDPNSTDVLDDAIAALLPGS